MLVTQVAGAATLATVPVPTPEIARTFGIDSSFVGICTGILFAASTLVLLVSGSIISQFGAVRTNQVAVGGSSLALLFVFIPNSWSLAMSALFVGAAYG